MTIDYVAGVRAPSRSKDPKLMGVSTFQVI